MCPWQVQRLGGHLVVWHHHSGAGARACALRALPAHESAPDDHPEPAPVPGVRLQEALLQGRGDFISIDDAAVIAYMVHAACLAQAAEGCLTLTASQGLPQELMSWSCSGAGDAGHCCQVLSEGSVQAANGNTAARSQVL